MGLILDYHYGQTPLSEEETDGLRIKSIATHGELDEFEQLNIQKAVQWAMSKRFTQPTILTEQFIKKVHRQMFSEVWKWAGTFRQSEKNLGVAWHQIGLDLRQLLDDTNFWIANSTFPPDEIVLRFKHRLVSIHCFPNGNGRHARLIADIMIENIFELPIFNWNNSNIVRPDETRNNYITALKAADNGSIKELIAFARA